VQQRKSAFNVLLKLLMGYPVSSVRPDLVPLPSTAAKDIAEILKRIVKEQG
jgi:hypothetical protein